MLKKKIKLLTLTATLSTVLLSTNVFALGINHNDNSSERSVKASELPNDFISMHFASEEQADLYFDKVVENLENAKTEELTTHIVVSNDHDMF